MAQFSVNTHRFDPYKNFKFLVKFGTDTVAGVHKVTALKRTTDVVTHREGGDLSTPRLQPGPSKFEAVTLERGITHDLAFEEWAKLVFNSEGDGSVSLKDFRRDIRIEMLNLQGVVVRAYNIFRCWVSEYTAMPDLDANGNGVAFESIVIQNEGFERDDAIVEVPES